MANTANTSGFLATGLQFSHAIIQPWWFSSTCIASMFAHFKTTKIDTKEGYYRMTWLDMTKTMDNASDAMWCYVFSLDRKLRPVSKLLTSDSKTPPKTRLVAPETAPRSNTPWRPALKSLTRWTGNLWNWRKSRQAIIVSCAYHAILLASQCQRQWLVSTSKCRLVLSAAPSLRPAHDSRDLQPQAQNCNRNGMGKHMQKSRSKWLTLDKKLSPLTPWTARRKSWHKKEITSRFFLLQKWTTW